MGFEAKKRTVYDELINKYASSIKIEVYRTLIKIESNFNPDAESNMGAIGLMQLTSGVVTDFVRAFPRQNGITVNDEENNVKMGVWYLEKAIPKYLKEFGFDDNIRNRLTAYYYGIGNMVKGDFSDGYIYKFEHYIDLKKYEIVNVNIFYGSIFGLIGLIKFWR